MKTKLSNLRIIAGSLKGRKIHFQPEDGLRPTPDRIRETLFNWLMHDIRGARCLDLFAGSGALAFEAVSRGASVIQAVEKNPINVKEIEKNKQILNIDNLEIIFSDALNFLDKHPETPYDIIFLDPPYQSDLILTSLEKLLNNNFMHADTLIYTESNKNIDFGTGFLLKKQKKSTSIYYSLLGLIKS